MLGSGVLLHNAVKGRDHYVQPVENAGLITTCGLTRITVKTIKPLLGFLNNHQTWLTFS